MNKFSAAIAFAIGLTASVAYAEQSTPVNIEDLEPECIALTPAGNGQYDCMKKGDPTDGKFWFMTWENNGSVIVRGYPWFDNRGRMGRIDRPTSYRMCQDMVDLAWNHEDFEKFDEIWCVRAGE